MPVSNIEQAMQDIRDGKFVVLVDDENRENEGDLVIAAEKITPEAVNFMAKEARGLICLAMTPEMCEKLNLQLQAPENTAKFETPFTVSVDAAHGITTGISAYDRSHTVQIAISDDARPSDLARPGHIFPLKARHGGVLVRAGQTEGSVDLAKLAGLKPAGVLCEIMNEDGTMARMPQLEEFCAKHDIKLVTVADLIKYRRIRESTVQCTEIVDMPTKYGDFRLHQYESRFGNIMTHLALTKGDIGRPDPETDAPVQDEPVLVRVHDECLTGDTFGSRRCDCGEQLGKALQLIEAEGKGALLYMRQEGRGIGLENKIHAYALQDKGVDTVEANVLLGFKPDLREYGVGAQILTDLGIRKLKLLTNNPKKIVALQGYNLEISSRVPLEIPPCDSNRKYLDTKKKRMGHMLGDCEE